jgi:hypothetical protein
MPARKPSHPTLTLLFESRREASIAGDAIGVTASGAVRSMMAADAACPHEHHAIGVVASGQATNDYDQSSSSAASRAALIAASRALTIASCTRRICSRGMLSKLNVVSVLIGAPFGSPPCLTVCE